MALRHGVACRGAYAFDVYRYLRFAALICRAMIEVFATY